MASYDVLYYIIYLTFAKTNHLYDIHKLYIEQCIFYHCNNRKHSLKKAIN